MSRKITHYPTAEQLYSERDNIAKGTLALTMAEARGLARWAGGRVPNGPAAGALMHGHNIGHEDLDLAIAMIVARVRDETKTAIYCRGASHVAAITDGVRAVAGSLTKADDYAKLPKPREMARARNARQLAVRKTGKCDNCGAEFASSEPAFAPGPAKRTPKQWAQAFRDVAEGRPTKSKRRTTRTVLVFPGDPDLELGRVSKTDIPSGLVPTYSMGKLRPQREKIPNHNGAPTGKHPKSSKGKRK